MGWLTQDKDGDHEVLVKGGESYDRGGQATTEFLFIDHSNPNGDRDHIVISDTGEVVHDTTGSANSAGNEEK
jgi:hypothetical protein